MAQTIARVLLRGIGELEWSDRRLAREAGVDIAQVRGALKGTSWVALFTPVRLLRMVGAELHVEEETDPVRDRSLRRKQET